MEAELNPPMIRLAPGESYPRETSWLPLCVSDKVTDVGRAGAIVTPQPAVAQSSSLLVSGSSGVFFPGRLKACFLDARGKEIAAMDLGAAMPQTPVNLRPVKCPVGARQVSVLLIDDQGKDRGSLGEALVSAERRES